MPFDTVLASETLGSELLGLGIADALVEIEALDAAAESFLVRITSEAFEGQTFLDRETRIRPMVSRTFMSFGRPRANFVIDARAKSEVTVTPDSGADYETSESETSEDRIGRVRWREEQAAILRALNASDYRVEQLEKEIFVASRIQLSEERILVGVAKAPKASCVDLDVRKAMEAARKSQRFNSAIYIAPNRLETPFANQPKADSWLKVQTTVEFLHLLNKSAALAEALQKECEALLGRLKAGERGPVIEPKTNEGDDGQPGPTFFGSLNSWIGRKDASFLVLMAPAGHGKTTLTVELTRRLATAFLKNQSEQPVPLFVPFETVRRTVDFEALLHKRLAELRAASFGAFKELLRLNRAVLLVDGFDELADDAGFDVAEHQIRSMKPILGGASKILLAGRSVFTQQFAGDKPVAEKVRELLGDVAVETIEIEPFTEEQIGEFVDTREGLFPAQVQKLKEFAFQAPDQEELCSIPLFLRILASLVADDKLPALGDSALGVDILIEKVCEREEERQNLGLGMNGQLEFLEWLATEAFTTGRASFAPGDVKVIAVSVAESYGVPPEIAGRLSDHAFLIPVGSDRLAFIHPMIRDVILGRSIFASQSKAAKGQESIAARDLPEGAVQYIARSKNAGVQQLPNGWLSTSSSMRQQERRNLFRIAQEHARFSTAGNPRDWVRPSWMEDGAITGMDFSGLMLASTSLDNLRFANCDLSYSLIDDCDIRGTSFDGCDFLAATFRDCRGSITTVVRRGVVDGVHVSAPDGFHVLGSAGELTDALRIGAEVEAQVPKRPSRDVVESCRKLMKEVLRRMVEVDPVRFHGRGPEDLRLQMPTLEFAEKTAVEKVIVPIVISSLCDTKLRGGSKESVSVSGRWQKPVVELLKNERMTPGLPDVLSKIARKDARYLDEKRSCSALMVRAREPLPHMAGSCAITGGHAP